MDLVRGITQMNKTVATSVFAATLGLTLLAGAPANAEDAAPEVTPSASATVAAEPTVPAAEPTVPAVEPTVPAAEPTVPAVEPTVPAVEVPVVEAPATEAPAVEVPAVETPAAEVPTADPSDQPVAEEEAAIEVQPAAAEASVVFDNCTDARAAGAVNIPASDPRYGTHLDRDLDGIGCEEGGADAPAADVSVSAPIAGSNQAAAQVYTPASSSSSELAYTGAADWALPLGAGVVGVGVVLFGAAKLRRRSA